MELNAIFEQLKATSGKNAKLAILQKYKNNALFRDVIEAALNPFKTYYIKKIPEYTPGPPDGMPLVEALNWTKRLSKRKVTGVAAIAELRNVLEALAPDNAKVLERIIEKDLDCGVDTAVEKVWPGLVPEFQIMLCEPYDEKYIKRMKWPALAELKADGMRFNAVVRDGKVTYFSRKGRQMEIHGVWDHFFAKHGDYVYDGEALVWDEDHTSYLPRKTGNGILGKSVKGTLSKAEAQDITFKLWDMIPTAEWDKRKGTEKFSVRRTRLHKLFDEENLVEGTMVKTLDEAVVVFEGYLKKGLEGIILKSLETVWEDCRSKSQIKFKAEKDCDLEVVAWYVGKDGKYRGLMGGLTCQSSDGELTVNIGGGWSDEQRKSIKKGDMEGKIIAVMYNEKIQKESGEWSLFLPRFIEVRDDKTNADSFAKIK